MEVKHLKDSPEAIALEKAIIDKWVEVKEVTINRFLHTKNLGVGEKEAISLAFNLKIPVLIDDDSAKVYASLLGVEAHGSFYAIYLACLKKFISKEEAKKIFKDLMKEGFYASTELYLRFLDLLDEL